MSGSIISFDAVAQRIINAGMATADDIAGCTESEVALVESQAGRRLPAAYRQFLLTMGRSAGEFYSGTDMFFPDILHLTSQARTLLEGTQSEFRLPERAFVFSMHQGYQFAYFPMENDDDPAVYHYMEGDSGPEKSADSFSQFILTSLEQYEKVRTRDLG